MAIVSNTQTRYGEQGLRESLSDVIYRISPTDTPFVSSIRSGKRAKQTLEEWQTHSLSAADGTNAQLEGDDISSYAAAQSTVRVGNYTQISRKLVIVSDTVEAIDKAGRKSQLAFEITYRGEELKRDIETVMLRAQGGNAGGTGTARTLASLNAWVKTNTSAGSGGGDPTYTSGVPGAARTDGTQRAFTETIAKAVIQSAWNEGAKLKVIMVGPFNKQTVSGFSGIATRNFDMSNVSPAPTAIIAAADVYVSDFGVLRVIPNRFQRERDAWFLDWDMLEMRELRPMQTVRLAKTGDAEKRMLVTEYTLCVKQEAGLGLAADLNAS